ncbi:MAG: efflux RND transporter periplasmic adaptor subunit [Polyangiales bacterium]
MNPTHPTKSMKPMSSLVPRTFLAPSSLALVALFALGCGSAQADAPEHGGGEPDAVSVQVAQATEGPVAASYTGTGTVRGLNTATLTSRMMGYVRTLDATVGQRVTRGQLLATLDDADPRAGLLQARAGTLEAEAARVQYAQQADAAEADLRLARTTHERIQALAAERAVPQQRADEAEAALRAAEARFAASQSGMNRASSRIAQSQAMVQSARNALEYTRVRAPFDGVVLARPAQVGDLSAPGMPLYILEQDGGRRVEVALPESMVGTVSVGQAVTVRVEAAERVLTGTVGEVSPLVDPAARAFMVKVDLPADALDGVDPGMFARVLFPRPAEVRLTVPRAAVSARASLDRVFVVNDDVAELRLVTLGAAVDDEVAVLSGLSPGETVVVDAPATLRDRDHVEVRP